MPASTLPFTAPQTYLTLTQRHTRPQQNPDKTIAKENFMTTSPLSIKRIITYAGAFIAFLIGSGFATGQEIMQYFSSYGWSGMVGIGVVFALFLYVGYEFVLTGYNERFKSSGEIYTHMCGKWVGIFFDYFSILFIYMSFVVMIGGAAATVEQQYQMAPWMGGVLMGVVSAITVVAGLGRVIDIVGKVGPVIVVLTISLGAWSLASSPESLSHAQAVIPTLVEQKALLTASSNWFFAALSYVGFCMLWLAGFMSLMGSEAKNLKEIKIGSMLGAFGFSFALLIMALGFMANIEFLADSAVPTLKMANTIHSAFGIVFSLIVVAGIYTTAVPLLWQASARFTGGKGSRFVTATFVLAAIGIFIGLKVPFKDLINVIYVINGYVGFILLFFMVINTIKRIGKKA